MLTTLARKLTMPAGRIMAVVARRSARGDGCAGQARGAARPRGRRFETGPHRQRRRPGRPAVREPLGTSLAYAFVARWRMAQRGPGSYMPFLPRDGRATRPSRAATPDHRTGPIALDPAVVARYAVYGWQSVGPLLILILWPRRTPMRRGFPLLIAVGIVRTSNPARTTVPSPLALSWRVVLTRVCGGMRRLSLAI